MLNSTNHNHIAQACGVGGNNGKKFLITVTGGWHRCHQFHPSLCLTASHHPAQPSPTLTICPAHDQYPASILLVNIVLSDSVLIHAHLIVNIRDILSTCTAHWYHFLQFSSFFGFRYLYLMSEMWENQICTACDCEPWVYSTDDREINYSRKITEPRVCLLSWASGAPVSDWRCTLLSSACCWLEVMLVHWAQSCLGQ